MAKKVITLEVDVNTGPAENSVKSFKARLKEAVLELNTVTEKFGATSKEAANAAKNVAKLKDTMGDAKQLADTFNPDKKFVALGGALQGAVGGFTALTGAMGLFGGESKEVEKLLLKVQSAMALQQGISAIFGAVDAFKLLGKTIVTNVVAAFATLKSAIITTGIGALVITIGYLISKMDMFSKSAETAADAQNRLADATKNANSAISEQIGFIDEINSQNIKRAKIEGASEATITSMTKKQIQDRIDIRNKEIDERLKNGLAITELTQQNGRDITALQNLDLDNQIKAADAGRNVAKAASDKRAEDAKAAAEARLEKERELQTGLYKMGITVARENAADLAEFEAELKAGEAAADAEKAAADKIKTQQETEAWQRRAATVKAVNDAELADAKILAQQKLQLAYDTSNALGALSEVLGKQSAAGKALAVAQALINTYQGISRGVAMGMPWGIPSIIAAAATGFKAVKDIIKTKIPGQSAGGVSTAAPSLGSVAAPLQPQAQTTALNQASINQIGNAANRAFVLETDVSTNQERVRRLNRAARIN